MVVGSQFMVLRRWGVGRCKWQIAITANFLGRLIKCNFPERDRVSDIRVICSIVPVTLQD
jgi:hypothetical protein